MKVSNIPVINQITGSGSFTSSASSVQQVQKASFQWSLSSGSFVGTMQIQGSNDVAGGGQSLNLFQPRNWNVIGSASTTPAIVVVNGSATATTGVSVLVEKPTNDLCFEYIRVVVNDTLGDAGARGVFTVRMKTHSSD